MTVPATTAVTPLGAPAAGHVSVRHIGGLDGLRGVAVAAVVVYHLWPSMLPAGFLGVTLFFALSGYLITTLLLDELDRTGRVSLRAFWARRLRRLMPASWMVLAGVLAVWALAGWLTEAIRRDVLWSALHVANWGRIAEAQAYGVSPEASPVLHFWSLSIEEQCYLVLPVLVVVAARRQRVGALLSMCFAASVASVLWAWGDPVRAYFSTFTRGGELLAGALAAVAVRHLARSSSRLADAVAVTGLIVLALAARATSLDSGMYSRGGLLFAGILAAVSVAAVGASARLGSLLDVRPFAWLGSVSYAVYLVHWPLLVGLRAAGIGPRLAPWLTVVATLVLAQVSARVLERPIRARRLLTRRPGLVATGALSALVVATVVVPDTSTVAVFDADRAAQLAEQRRDDLTVSSSTVPSSTGPSSPGPSSPGPSSTVDEPTVATPVPPDASPSSTSPPRPIRYAWVSDSTGLPLVLGIRSPDGFEVAGWWTEMGCPVGRGGRVRSMSTGSAVWTTAEKGCDWDESLTQALPPGGVDVALVSFGRWDVAERQVPALGDGWTTIDDPRYEQWLLAEMRALTARLHASGVTTVVWLTLVHDDAHGPRERVDRFNDLLRSITDRPAESPTDGRVEVLDLAGWLESTGEIDRLLPDGVHATFEPEGGTADEIGRRFLFPGLQRLLGA